MSRDGLHESGVRRRNGRSGVAAMEAMMLRGRFRVGWQVQEVAMARCLGSGENGWVGAMGGGGRGRKGKKVALDDAVLRVGLQSQTQG